MRAEPTIHEIMTADLENIEPQRRFGRTGKPVPATDVYHRVVSTLLRDGIRVERWIIVNERDQSVTFAITYNGIAGSHFDAGRNTHWLNWDTLQSRLEDYQYVPTDECPIATPVARVAMPRRIRVA
jgi:hypothetical protein